MSVGQKGAHNEKFLHAPANEEIEKLLSIGGDVIKRITAAPELDNMEYFAKKMSENGVHLSIGHSDATSDVALLGFKNGFSHITHMYNVTPSIRKIGQTVTAGIMGMRDRGKIENNLLADFVVFDENLKVLDVIKSGKKICL